MGVPRLVSADSDNGRLPAVVVDYIVSTIGTETIRPPRGDGVTDQRAAIQAGLNTASSAGATYALNGPNAVNGTLTVPSNVTLDMSQGSLTQLATRAVTLSIDGAANVRVRGGSIIGKLSDYVNTSQVYASTAISVRGAASNVVIQDVTITAATGIEIANTATDVRVVSNRIFGPGSSAILDNTYNYGAGVVATTTGVFSVENNLITGFAQGVVTGEGYSNLRIVNNVIRDIPGQHGLYLETARRGVVAGNIITSTGLCGMKMQMATDAAGDAVDFVLSNNVITQAGAQGILLTNTIANPANRVKRFVITGNVITDVNGPGIHGIYSTSVVVANNIVTNSASTGMTFDRTSGLTIENNRIDGCGDQGIFLANTSQFRLLFNEVLNPASRDVSTTEFGIQIGTSTSEGEIVGNRALDLAGKMRYGLYILGDTTSMRIKDNTTTGATDAGYRGPGTSARAFMNNVFNTGTAGAMVSPPSNYPVLTNTSGAALADLEAEVNKLKDALRNATLAR
jgi:parallel beta-helix repeat protein